MGDKTKIAWTDSTWNTVVGCSKTSPGCRECYAEKLLASRMKHMPIYGDVTSGGKWTGQTGLLPHRLDQPLRWKRARKIFVNDLGDTFHETVPFEFIAAVFGVMAACPQHTFQVLTKRPGRMLEFFEWLEQRAKSGAIRRMSEDFSAPRWMQYVCVEFAHSFTTAHQHRPAYDHRVHWPLPNVWLGVTCEDQQRANERIPLLLQCPAAVRFVSAEPLLGAIDFRDIVRTRIQCEEHFSAFECDVDPEDDDFGGAILEWLIVGGESGPKARPCDVEWIRSIRDQCAAAGDPCFIKQLGSNARWDGWKNHVGARWEGGWKMHLRDRAGADPTEWPEDLRVREYPR